MEYIMTSETKQNIHTFKLFDVSTCVDNTVTYFAIA